MRTHFGSFNELDPLLDHRLARPICWVSFAGEEELDGTLLICEKADEALFVMKKNRENKLCPVIASIVLLAVFMIPHSVLGSEIDFTKDQKVEVAK